MPKMKTHRGAFKRFKRTGSGKFKRNRAFGSHLFTSKSPKRKRRINSPALVDAADMGRITRLLPYC